MGHSRRKFYSFVKEFRKSTVLWDYQLIGNHQKVTLDNIFEIHGFDPAESQIMNFLPYPSLGYVQTGLTIHILHRLDYFNWWHGYFSFL